MDETRIRVHTDLVNALENIRKEIALDIKNKYGLKEITINGNVASQALAAKLNGRKLNFKIRKVGLNKGILELL